MDDEAGIRGLLVRWLTAAGYDIREAPDLEQAVEAIGSATPDALMCDVELPGQGGLRAPALLAGEDRLGKWLDSIEK